MNFNILTIYLSCVWSAQIPSSPPPPPPPPSPPPTSPPPSTPSSPQSPPPPGSARNISIFLQFIIVVCGLPGQSVTSPPLLGRILIEGGAKCQVISIKLSSQCTQYSNKAVRGLGLLKQGQHLKLHLLLHLHHQLLFLRDD